MGFPKGAEHPLWSWAGFKPAHEINDGCFARGLSMTGVRPYSAAPLASSSADCWEKVPPEPVT